MTIWSRMTKKLKIDLAIGDCRDRLKEMEPESIDVLITDPPYGLGDEPDPVEVMRAWVHEGHHGGKSSGGFMGRKWDAMCPGPGVWRSVKNVMKCGAKGAVFSGARTLHLMTASLRMAGFEIEDVVAWVFGSGFPKSHNVHKHVGKKVDARYGEKRCKCVGDCYQYSDDLYDPKAELDFDRKHNRKLVLDDYEDNDLVTRVCSWCSLPDQAYIDSLEGRGLALKPAFEPVVLVSKPHEPVAIDLCELLEGYGFSEGEIEYIMTSPEE